MTKCNCKEEKYRKEIMNSLKGVKLLVDEASGCIWFNEKDWHEVTNRIFKAGQSYEKAKFKRAIEKFHSIVYCKTCGISGMGSLDTMECLPKRDHIIVLKFEKAIQILKEEMKE